MSGDSPPNSDASTDWATPSTEGSGPPWRLVLVIALLLGGLGWVVRPVLHVVVYTLYTRPILLLAIAAGIAAAIVVARTDYTGPPIDYRGGGTSADQFTPLRVAAVVVILGLLVLTPVANTIAGATLSDETLAQTNEVDDLDDVDPQKPRIVTRAVASRYASNTLNRPQYRAGDTDISVVDGTPYWSAPLSPDGLFNVLTKKQGGTVLVNMTTKQANVRVVDGQLETGIGTIFYESYRWRLLKQGEYLVDYGDPKMIVVDGTQHIIVPYSKPQFHLTPIPHTTPTWGGVAIIDPDGSIEMLSPQQAADSPLLDGQQLYPERLARQKVAATKYRNGILNTFTSHEDEIEIAPVPGDENDQPFFVLSEDGPQYVVAVEPYGEAQGLREVWTIDGQTGKFEVYRPNTSLFGPQKAADLVRQSAPQTDWNRFSPAEPILTVIDDTKYWQVRIVPEDNSGIAYVAFVNAETGDVREFDQTNAIRQFLAGELPSDTRGNETSDPDRPQPTMIVQRVAPNGTVVETMEVYGNETVRIQSGANATAEATRRTTPTPTDTAS
jgi:hypothetical protein